LWKQVRRVSLKALPRFKKHELGVVNEAVALAEELASNAYKMSFAEWRRRRYDVRTLADLSPEEVVDGPFAQIMRYVGRKAETSLGSSTYDFYKICLQDHSILATLKALPELGLFPFSLYIVTHELIHVIRFTKFLQAFDASVEEKLEEEARVHERTREILGRAPISGRDAVFEFYRDWEGVLDLVRDV
jgi:hypothetical protein